MGSGGCEHGPCYAQAGTQLMESVLVHKINIAPSAYFRPSAPSPCSAQPPYLSPLAAQRRYAEATAWYERALALEPRRWILPRPLAQPSLAHLTSEGLPRWRNPIPSAPVRLPSALSLAAAQGPGAQTPPPLAAAQRSRRWASRRSWLGGIRRRWSATIRRVRESLGSFVPFCAAHRLRSAEAAWPTAWRTLPPCERRKRWRQGRGSPSTR